MIKTALCIILVLLSCSPQKSLQEKESLFQQRSNYMLELSAVDPSEAVDKIMTALGGRASFTWIQGEDFNPFSNQVETLEVFCTGITQQEFETLLLLLHNCHSILTLAVHKR